MPTMAQQYLKLYATNATSTSFASKIITGTPPAGDGVIATGGETLEILPFGAGADDDTFELKVIGWRRADVLWVPRNICHLAVTLSTAVGLAGKYVVETDRFADAITVTTGSANVVVPTVTANSPCMAIINIEGDEKIEIVFDRTGATTSCNVLYSRH